MVFEGPDSIDLLVARLFEASEDAGPSMLALWCIIALGVACQLFVLDQARRYPPALLACISVLGFLLPLPVIALGARAALSEEQLELASRLGTGSPEGVVLTFLTRAFLTTVFLVPLFVLAGFALAAVMRAAGSPASESFAPLAGGIALAVLCCGLAWVAFSQYDLFPRGTVCGPISKEELLWVENGDLAPQWRHVVSVFVVFLVLAASLGGMGWLSSILRPSTHSSWVLSLSMLGVSAVLVSEARPFFMEARAERLPFLSTRVAMQSLDSDRVRTPKLVGPDELTWAPTVFVTSGGVSIGREQLDSSQLEGHFRKLLHEHLKRNFLLDNEFGRSLFRPILLARSGATQAEFRSLLQQLQSSASSVQLTFIQWTTIDRPVLGRLTAVTGESALTIALKPEPGSSPVEFHEAETYESFASRAIEARKAGPIHLVLP